MTVKQASGPRARWQALIDAGNIQPDPHQERVILRLQSLHERLTESRPGLLDRLRRRPPVVSGMYLHGPVGRGKTMLMDLFAESLMDAEIPVERLHFHRFMDRVHRTLKDLEGRRDPLKTIAGDMAARHRVLCFDEFHVSDIGDAMILGELLKRLFERGVTLVATSNTVPDDLYADGLQRARFVPAIEAIKAHCDIVALEAHEDYRLRELVRHPTWLCPDNAVNLAELNEEFQALAAGETVSKAPLRIRGRDVQPRRRAGSVAWFDFDTLCRGHRSSADYIELSRRFSTLIVQGVPAMDDQDANAARRFIHLVDECYDRAVKLIIVAAVPIVEVYSGERLTQPFERTVSRLIEMQSRDYLALPHRP
ncbi:MAG: AFG1 family ATPase [Wenzhouxiangella sp.]|nr:MAG: AFG1 family ATPase [Wenzhouxiangella sp.]